MLLTDVEYRHWTISPIHKDLANRRLAWLYSYAPYDGKGTSVLCDWLLVSRRTVNSATDHAHAVRRRSSANVQSIYQSLPQIFSPRLQMSVKGENHSLNDSLMFHFLRNKGLYKFILKSLT